MSFILVPHGVTSTTATIWVGAIDENARTKSVKLEYVGDGEEGVVELNVSAWETWRAYQPTDRGSYLPWDWVLATGRPRVKALHYQRVELRSLKPRTSHSLVLRVDGQTTVGLEKHLREGQVTTLPEMLPTKEEPFTLLLGSCFYGPEDSDGMVGTTYHYLPEKQRPDIKILCGDQVYLDNPWRETTLNWYQAFQVPGLFRAMLFKKYEDNWKQVRGEDAGFRHLLKDGANYFCSDDHEFWNNAPNFGGVGLINTLTVRQRGWWFMEAADLLKAFQSQSPLVRFEVYPLSFCIADTRVNRDPKGYQFMNEEDLEVVKDWIANLEGPGVLVIGQPLLTEKTDKWSYVRNPSFQNIKSLAMSYFDKELPDYEVQYRELKECILKSPHSIVLLTGDVHFGRVASLDIDPGRGTKLVEVISSPMQSLLDQKGDYMFGEYQDAPPLRQEQEVESLRPFPEKGQKNHFVTIQFSSGEGSKNTKEINMRVKYWPILRPGDGAPPLACEVFETTLS
jgi:hypothetical protein